ncbi:MAG: Modulator of FtsH protease HflK [Pseudomonadota bacterium]|jgi:membrane protease subunit HflK
MSYQDPWDVFKKKSEEKAKSNNKSGFENNQKKPDNKPPLINFDFFSYNNKQFVFLALIIIFAIWLSTGVYIVKQEEKGIILRFSKYVRDAQPGLNYKIPYPVETIIKEPVARVRTIRIGESQAFFQNSLSNKYSNNSSTENLMLTGDENIINVVFEIQWKIDDLKKFAFNVKDQGITLQDAAKSAIRDVISQQKLASILTNNRAKIEEDIKILLQEILNSYNIGVEIVLVQMLKSDPPVQVIDAFKDVQTARVDKESEINKALAYENEVVYLAKGEAKRIVEEAKSYATKTINDATGNVARFDKIYEQYKNYPYATRQRMYIETMEDVFSKNQAYIVDSNIKNVIISQKGSNVDKETIASQAQDGQ